MLATPSTCAYENVLAKGVTTAGVLEVTVNNKPVTRYINEDGPGIDVNESTAIQVVFVQEEIIDFLEVLPGSNVKSYFISYAASDNVDRIIQEVIFFFVCFSFKFNKQF